MEDSKLRRILSLSLSKLPAIYEQKMKDVSADRTGSLDSGKWADIIAVKGDPLQDVKLLQHVAFVMKSGKVFKNELQ